MDRAIKLLKFVYIFFLIAMFTACAPAKKNQNYEKKMQGSHLHTSQLGRNRYYFSSNYQKRLNKNYKKK